MINNKSRESLEAVIHSASEKDMRHIRRRTRAKNVDTVERERERERELLFIQHGNCLLDHTHIYIYIYNIIKRNKKKNRNYLFRV